MGILIRNPETERKARELAKLRGLTLTAAIEGALDHALAAETPPIRKARTIEEMRAATDEFRRQVGLDNMKLNVTREDFDALNEIPGLDPS
ncbi:MAG: type II toxin-antitoxin system VapB family antitoxin [Caulobacterales bacterium]|nr:type II toxin-antitoxin system VapB family antitoxin [Caulobacterales bacterium]